MIEIYDNSGLISIELLQNVQLVKVNLAIENQNMNLDAFERYENVKMELDRVEVAINCQPDQYKPQINFGKTQTKHLHCT